MEVLNKRQGTSECRIRSLLLEVGLERTTSSVLSSSNGDLQLILAGWLCDPRPAGVGQQHLAEFPTMDISQTVPVKRMRANIECVNAGLAK